MIVHIITGLGRGGAENALFRLLTHGLDSGPSHVISLSGEGHFGPKLRASGIEVTCLNLNPLFPSPLKIARLIFILRRLRPNLVQTWMYHADLLGGLVGWIVGVPVCWGVRHTDLVPGQSKRSTRIVAAACAALSRYIPARIVSCSHRGVTAHSSIGYRAPFVVVQNGVNITEWRPQPELRSGMRTSLGLPADAFVFAHAGRADRQKDHPSLARAFNDVYERNPNCYLMLCGKSLRVGDEYFSKLPFSTHALRNVLALGPRDDLPLLWQSADAFVLSSSGEAFSNVLVEAMACGLPCIATDTGDAAEILGDTGVMVPPCLPGLLGEAMLDLSRMSEPAHQELARKARERVAANFTVERMVAGFNAVWREVLNPGNS